MSNTFIFTSESVGEGHPDKICDIISDTILDECLASDPFSRVAVDTVVKSNVVHLVGEISTRATIDYEKIVRGVLRSIGYTSREYGICSESCKIMVDVQQQSPDIAQGLEHNSNDPFDLGAGDQGIMFGYATDETPERMPLTVVLSHNLAKRLEHLRKIEKISWLRPDCKTQVTLEYQSDNGALKPLRLHTLVISTQHSDDVDTEYIKRYLKENVVKHVIPDKFIDDQTILHLQPSGRFVIGGPEADSGLTGRKIIVDTYGGWGAHGGGAFSGKDWSKVDRSGAYAARWVARSLVDNGICRRALVQLSYAIGVSEPLSLYVDTYGTSKYTQDEIIEMIHKNFKLGLSSIVKELNLAKPIYKSTAKYGHFGRDGCSWEISKKIEK